MIHGWPGMQSKQKGNLIWTSKHTPVPAQYPAKLEKFSISFCLY